MTDVQVEKEREKSFPTWLRSRYELVLADDELEDMVRGGRSQRVSTSVGRGSTSPSTTGTASPSTSVVPADDQSAPM
ncbi:hypothetical protein Taro_043513 [Colocasia esculenta]|uniref:Uncharacterized protein n=1 Tax=Colocasia esculenta TaxID=4460 RepID=A0A843X480_COLES|nr:hypothetical protein [Colocasia esculenta]